MNEISTLKVIKYDICIVLKGYTQTKKVYFNRMFSTGMDFRRNLSFMEQIKVLN